MMIGLCTVRPSPSTPILVPSILGTPPPGRLEEVEGGGVGHVIEDWHSVALLSRLPHHGPGIVGQGDDLGASDGSPFARVSQQKRLQRGINLALDGFLLVAIELRNRRRAHHIAPCPPVIGFRAPTLNPLGEPGPTSRGRLRRVRTLFVSTCRSLTR